MNCPKCDTPSLKPAQVRGIEVDRCSSCSGIWFDDRELPVLLGFTRDDLRKLQSCKESEQLNRKKGHCPRDGSHLIRVYSADNKSVVVDTCGTCNGVWLDGGELAKLRAH